MTISYASFHKSHLELVENCNLKLDIKVISDRCYVFCNIACNSDQIARRISKKANITVLSFLYVDDDSFVMQLFLNGKVIAKHYNTCTLLQSSKPDNFSKEFNLCDNDRKLFKQILKVDGLQTQIHYLEGILRIPLLIDEEIYQENPKTYKTLHSFISTDQIQSELKASRVKNTKMAECIFETTAPCRINYNRTSPYFVVKTKASFFEFCKIDTNNKIDKLWELCDSNIYEIDCFKKTNNDFAYSYNQTVVFSDEKGNVRNKVVLPANSHVINISGNEIVTYYYYNKKTNSYITEKIDNNGKLTFSLPHAVPLLIDNLYSTKDAFVKNDEKGNELCRYRKETTVVSTKDEEKVHYHSELLKKADQNKIWYFYNLYKNQAYTSYLELLDENLNILEKFDISNSSYTVSQIIEDKTNNRLLLVGLDEITPIDLKTKTIKEPVKMRNNAILYIDNNGNIYNRKGNSTLEIYNSDFKLVSANKLKGFILEYYGSDKNGCPRFLTAESISLLSSDEMFRIYSIYSLI